MEPKTNTPDQQKKCNTPGDLFNRFADFVSVKTHLKTDIKGIYYKGDYPFSGGDYLDKLKDELTDHTMNIVVPQNIRATLEEGTVVKLHGTIKHYYSKDCSIRFQLNVTSADTIAQYSAFALHEQTCQRIRASKKPHEYKRPGEILALIFAQSSITENDVLSALGDAARYYDIRTLRAPFTQPDQLTRALDNALQESPDAVCLIRGGGPDIRQLDTETLLEKTAHYPKPLITAIGHADDVTYLNQIADADFGTPSLLGTFLRDTALRARERVRMENQLTNEKNELTYRNAQLSMKVAKRNKLILYVSLVAAALLAGLILLLSDRYSPTPSEIPSDPPPTSIPAP